MAFGRVWHHAKYSCRVWESFAHQANSILKTFKKYPNREVRTFAVDARIRDPPSRKDSFYQPERRPVGVPSDKGGSGSIN
jgi:hypothetical protein